MLKRWIKIILVVLAAFFVIDAVLVIGIGFITPNIEHADDAVILGAAIYSVALHNRTEKAIELFKEGKVDALVLSGGKISVGDITEAQGMKKIIAKEVYPLPPIILEDKSNNTYENIKNTKALIGVDKSIVIVSDRFHIARAVMLAKRAGFKNVAWASPSLAHYSKNEIIYYYWREIVALPSYLLKLIWF